MVNVNHVEQPQLEQDHEQHDPAERRADRRQSRQGKDEHHSLSPQLTARNVVLVLLLLLCVPLLLLLALPVFLLLEFLLALPVFLRLIVVVVLRVSRRGERQRDASGE